MEYRDLYDENRNLTGEIIEKGKKIPSGRYILVVMIFIENSNGQFLIQKRSAEKGGKWATTGGHPKSGESSIEGICVEVEEEIGLKITKSEPTLFETIKTNETFLDLYYIKKNVDLKELKLQKEEVQDANWFSRNEIENFIEKQEFFKPHIEGYYCCLKYLKK